MCQYGHLYNWSICQCQVYDQLPFLVLSCPIVGGAAVISNFQSILVNHGFAESSILLRLSPWIALITVGDEVFCEDSAALANDFLPVQLSCRSLSLSGLQFICIINGVNPCYLFTSSPDVSSDDIVVATSIHVRPLINHRTTPFRYTRPNSVSFSYFLYRMVDPITSSFSRWLIEPYYVPLAFVSRLEGR
jgi:hypothetical protein